MKSFRGAVQFLILVLLAGLLYGCHTGVYKDPNDPADAGLMAPEVLRRNLKGISLALNERYASGEIGSDEYKQRIEDGAQELLSKVHLEKIAPAEAWQYLEVLLAAQRWKTAEQVGEIAVAQAKKTGDLDRLVNDVVRLAQAQAHQGKIEEAIATDRSVFNVPDKATAPILMATLYELVPAASGHGHDDELAKLLEEAIACHWRTKVDVNSEAGKLFLAARSTHIRKGWQEVISLYRSAGKDAEAQAAAQRAQKDMTRSATT